jgi:hypothetical protein
MSAQEIESELIKLEREIKAYKHEALKTTWFMRGGVDYDGAMNLTLEDRQIISDIIKDNLETTKKTGLNFF